MSLSSEMQRNYNPNDNLIPLQAITPEGIKSWIQAFPLSQAEKILAKYSDSWRLPDNSKYAFSIEGGITLIKKQEEKKQEEKKQVIENDKSNDRANKGNSEKAD